MRYSKILFTTCAIAFSVSGTAHAQKTPVPQESAPLSLAEQSVRVDAGLPAQPKDPLVHVIGNTRLTTKETKVYERFAFLMSSTQESKRKLDESPDIVSYGLVSGDINEPLLRIYIDRGQQKDILGDLVAGFGELPLEVVSSPITRSERDKMLEIVNSSLTREMFEAEGNEIVDVWVNGDWRINVATIKTSTGPAAERLTKELIELTENRESPINFSVMSSRPETIQAAARESSADNARGGKRIRVRANNFTVDCTSGPIVDIFNTLYILTAGHCIGGVLGLPESGLGSQGYSTDSPTVDVGNRVGGNAAHLGHWGYQELSSTSPYPWYNPAWNGYGADFALVDFPTGWGQVLNGHGPQFAVKKFGQPLYDRQAGSADPYSGQPFICTEGSSTARSGINDWTQCGTADGVAYTGSATPGDLRLNNMRRVLLSNFNNICQGDSGGSVRMPSGPNESYVTGINSAAAGPAVTTFTPAPGGVCFESQPGNPATVWVSSFWQIHQAFLNKFGNVPIWIRTY